MISKLWLQPYTHFHNTFFTVLDLNVKSTVHPQLYYKLLKMPFMFKVCSFKLKQPTIQCILLSHYFVHKHARCT